MAMIRIGLLPLAATGLGAGPALAAGPAFTATLDGSAQVPKVDSRAIKDGDAYVDVHPAEHKAGEIRGQIK